MTETEIYWILQADRIQYAIQGFLAVLIILTVILIAAWLGLKSENNDDGVLVVKRWLLLFTAPLLVVAIVGATLMPSTKALIMMRVIPALTNSDVMQSLPSDITEIYKAGMSEIKKKIVESVK